MSYKCYKGSTLNKKLYTGSTNIKKVYKGSTLVWQGDPYNPGTVLYENSTGGASTTLSLEEGLYRVTLVGGGGGGCGIGTKSSGGLLTGAAAGGGSGAGLDCVINLTKGNYSVYVGKGGTAKTASKVISTVQKAGNGTASSFGNLSVAAGVGGSANYNSTTAGTGGAKPSITYTYTTVYLQTAGKSGTTATGNSKNVSGGASVYSSKGAGGSAKSGDQGKAGTASAGGSGYVKVVYIGQA